MLHNFFISVRRSTSWSRWLKIQDNYNTEYGHARGNMMRMSLQPTVLLKIFLPFCKLRLQTALHGAEIGAT